MCFVEAEYGVGRVKTLLQSHLCNPIGQGAIIGGVQTSASGGVLSCEEPRRW